LGRVSYANVAPIYYGLENGLKPGWLDVVSRPPQELNRLMAAAALDISPVSSSAYARNQQDWLLLPDFSISSQGPVDSVLLVSRRPWEALQRGRVLLSQESAAAADLVKILLSRNGPLPHFERRRVHRPSQVPPDVDAALVIGDAALTGRWKDHFEFVWDLGERWHTLTSLPFVFAVWAVRKTFAQAHPQAVQRVIDLLNLSRRRGSAQRERLSLTAAGRLDLPTAVLKRYFERLYFGLGAPENTALTQFYQFLFEIGELSAPVRPVYFS
jgi:chorismate dehydratase